MPIHQPTNLSASASAFYSSSILSSTKSNSSLSQSTPLPSASMSCPTPAVLSPSSPIRTTSLPTLCEAPQPTQPTPPLIQYPQPSVSRSPSSNTIDPISSSPESSPPTICCAQTTSGSSTSSIVAPCSPSHSQSARDESSIPKGHAALPRIRKIHIDFNYRRPTPNLTPIEPSPEELLAKDFKFLTHEPRQPLYRPAVLRRSKFYPPTQPPAGQSDCCGPAACLHQTPQSPVSSFAGLHEAPSLLSPIRAYSSRSSFNVNSSAPLRALPHTPNIVIIEGRKFGRLLSKSRWVPDIQRESCAHDNCPQRFNFVNRKHHCRSCGDIFCRSHASQTAPLFDGGPGGEPTGQGLVDCRVCDTCSVTLSCGIDPISPRNSLRNLSSSPSSPTLTAKDHPTLSDSWLSGYSSTGSTQALPPRRRRNGQDRKRRPQSSKGSYPTSRDREIDTPTATVSSGSSHFTHSSPETLGSGRDLLQPRHSSMGPVEQESKIVYNCLNLNSKPYNPFPVIPVIKTKEEEVTRPVVSNEEQWPDHDEETEDEDEDAVVEEETVIKYRPSRLFW